MTEHQERTRRLAEAPLRSLLAHYAIPATVGTMVTALYNIVDRIFIGQGVGDYAIAGLALTFPILIFLQAFGMLVGAGASARVSIFLGQGDTEGAERVLGQAIVLTLLTQAMVITPSMIWMKPLLEAFGGSERTIPYAVEYLQVTVPGNIFMTLCFSYNAVMRASGYPRKAMYTMIIGAVLNTMLDALFIYGFGWGIAGAAWATVLSMIVSAAFVLSHFFSRESIIRFRRRHIGFSLGPIWAIASIGLSPFAVQLLGSLVSILFNRSFKAFSPTPEEADLAIGAYGIVNGYAMVGVMLMLGISQGMQPIVGFNYGAGLYARVRKTFRLCAGINTAVGLAVVISVLVASDFIASVFAKSPEIQAVGANALRKGLLGFAFVGFQITATQFLQSLGVARRSLLLSISRQTLFFIPLLLIMPPLLGVDGVWYAASISDTSSGILGMILINWQMRRMMRRGGLS